MCYTIQRGQGLSGYRTVHAMSGLTRPQGALSSSSRESEVSPRTDEARRQHFCYALRVRMASTSTAFHDVVGYYVLLF